MVSGQLGIGLKNDNGSLAYDGVYYNSCNWHQWNDPLYNTVLPPASGNGVCGLTINVTNHGFLCGEKHTYGYDVDYYVVGYPLDGSGVYSNSIVIGNSCL
jgi:hypothetical protein